MRELAWICGLLISIVYFIGAYLLPLIGLIPTITLIFKLQFEIILCSLIIVTGILNFSIDIHPVEIEVYFENNHIYLQFGKRIVGVRCLELLSVKERLADELVKVFEYDTSLLMAIRSGMRPFVNIAYEVGVVNQAPYIRFFLSYIGKDFDEIDKALHREAARTEAILLATLENVEIQQLSGTSLVSAIFSSIRSTPLESAREYLIEQSSHGSLSERTTTKMLRKNWSERSNADTFWLISGAPRSMPMMESSQIDKFISTLLQQGTSASLTCVFSPSKPKREKRKLESQWLKIRRREKIREDTLADHSVKEKLLDEYRVLQDSTGWFDVSITLYLRREEGDSVPTTTEDCLTGIVHSIWGGGDNFELRPIKINCSNELKLLLRRHITPQKMHVSRLVAYVNMPRRDLPELSAKFISGFKVPNRALVDNEIFIGWSLYKTRKLSKVGIKLDWIREHIAILGATGTGKTTLVRQIMAEISSKTRIPWWIFDVKGSEYLELLKILNDDVIVIKPGEDPNFVINFLDIGDRYDERKIDTTFTILNELLRERGTSSELSPAMERLLLQSLRTMAATPGDGSVAQLKQIIEETKTDKQISQLTKDALLNRLEILTRNPLAAILKGGPNAVQLSQFMNKRVIFDLRYVTRMGGMESARILYNLVAKRIFDAAMQRGITPGLQHVVVLEEASNLVPESYTRVSAADITTGESMVMLQRATGQGVIVVSTRPNISSNILANTGTKIVFRLPYDSSVGGRFLSLNEEQEKYLRSMKTGIALIDTPVTETFEIATVKNITIKSETPLETETVERRKLESIAGDTRQPVEQSDIENLTGLTQETYEKVYLYRIADIIRRVVALISTKGYLTDEQLHNALAIIDPDISGEKEDVIRELISLEAIERDSIGIVNGGVIYTLPGKSHEAATRLVTEFVKKQLIQAGFNPNGIHIENRLIFVEDVVILISLESIRSSTIEERVATFRMYIEQFGEEFRQMIIILRGSVAAAKIRELIVDESIFQDVKVVPAFPDSIEKTILELRKSDYKEQERGLTSDFETIEELKKERELDSEKAPSSLRIWTGLIEGYIDINDGCILWDDLIQLMETAVSQSHRRHSVIIKKEEGQRALSEMLIDEKLFAFRVTSKMKFVTLSEGLWIVSPTRLHVLRLEALNALEGELRQHHKAVWRNHSPLDICAGNVSFIVFPSKGLLDQVTNQEGEYVCQVCASHKLVCILPAIEYVDEFEEKPSFMQVMTLDDGLVKIVKS